MSYDICLKDPNTDEVIHFDKPHHIKGGTYAIGGTTEAWLNITYNYGEHFRNHIDAEEGIRWIYGKTGEEVLPKLRAAVETLGTEAYSDYWKSTPGNAGIALLGLIAFAETRPDGIFDGD